MKKRKAERILRPVDICIKLETQKELDDNVEIKKKALLDFIVKLLVETTLKEYDKTDD
ncbi:hypothetical protein [Mucilaginibacter terrigena]|uniref:hypothetical protein n=1 Tax=Mucilaginibacter terrigena TaxID=2492395 RepID=UPI001396C6A1|nr:hypothetical protein [Mucilaginibacter terrigena]